MAKTHDALRRMLGGQSGRAPVEDMAGLAEALARELSVRLSALTGAETAVTATGAAARLSDGAEDGALFGVARGAGDRLGAVAVFPADTADCLIEASVGGVGASAGGEARRFTPIDLALAAPAAHALFAAFEAALARRPGFGGAGRLAFDRFEQKHEEILAAHGDAEALAFSVSTTLREGGPALPMRLIAPVAALDDYRAAPARAPAPDTLKADGAWGAAMRAAASNAPVSLVGVLHQRALSVRELEQLQAGAVIPLPRGGRLDVELRLDAPEGVARQPAVGRGQLGGAEGWRAVRLTGALAPELTAAAAPYVE